MFGQETREIWSVLAGSPLPLANSGLLRSCRVSQTCASAHHGCHYSSPRRYPQVIQRDWTQEDTGVTRFNVDPVFCNLVSAVHLPFMAGSSRSQFQTSRGSYSRPQPNGSCIDSQTNISRCMCHVACFEVCRGLQNTVRVSGEAIVHGGILDTVMNILKCQTSSNGGSTIE